MKFVQLLSQLTATYSNPFFELPGLESQRKLSPIGREEWIQKMKINYRESAVMLLIYPNDENEAMMCLIQRKIAEGVPHSGQIGLPGGKYEQEDVNLIQTAVREAYEEVGVKVPSDRIVGRLSSVKIPVSGFEIFPCIGFLDEAPEFERQEEEVEQIVLVKVEDILTAEVFEKTFIGSGSKTEIVAPYIILNNFEVWGATAMILSEFRDLLK